MFSHFRSLTLFLRYAAQDLHEFPDFYYFLYIFLHRILLTKPPVICRRLVSSSGAETRGHELKKNNVLVSCTNLNGSSAPDPDWRS